MECPTPSRGYKDCEKGGPSEAENTSSRVSRQVGTWRGVQAKLGWLLVAAAATALIFHSALCWGSSTVQPSLDNNPPAQLHRPPPFHSRSASDIQVEPVEPVEPVASAGCSLSPNVSIGTSQVFEFGNRTNRLYLPVNYQPGTPSPLVLSYHGGTRTPQWQEELDLLNTTYFNKDYIVVYPQGLDKKWQGVPGVETDDVGFTSQLLDAVEAQYCVDTRRVYATGKSQGGGFVGVLACDAALSTRIAAFAPVSGGYYITDYGDTCEPATVAIEPCNPGRTTVPILEFHGLNDTTVPYLGGVRRKACLPAIPHWVQTWAGRDGLATSNVSSAVAGALDGSSAVMYEFGQGAQQGLVTHIMSGTGVGHDWPSTNPNHDNVARNGPASFNASSIILDWFARHPLV